MAYAISVGVVAVFLTIYLLLSRPIKPRYARFLDDEAFEAGAKRLVRTIPVPKKTGNISAGAYISWIKRSCFLMKRKRYLGEFDDFILSKDMLKQFSDASSASDLPSVDGVPRAVLLARYCISNSAYKLSADRIRTVLETQNEWRTLTFCEIDKMEQAFKFAFLEDLAALYAKLKTISKGYDLAKKYISQPDSVPKKYSSFVKSKLFLSICAKTVGYKADFYANLLEGYKSAFKAEFDAIMSSMDLVQNTDFTSFYSPLEIYDKYEIFSSASPAAKRNFLTLAGKISDRENLDEFLLAVRVDKYMNTASSGHMALKRFKMAGRCYACTSQYEDMTMLGAALSSHYFMDLYFRPAGRKFSNRSITKILEYDNSFEPIYKFRTINFGFSTKDNRIRFSPQMPDCVAEADVVLELRGVKHTLHLRRGDQKALYVGETLVMGVNSLALGNKPLDITLVLPRPTDNDPSRSPQ